MANLKSIKSKIVSYKKTGTVTHAMEAVSAVKMRKSQERALSLRAYAASALSVLERISGTADVAKHPLMQERPGHTAIVLVTSDKGLAGSLNSAVIRNTEQVLKERGLSKGEVTMYALGKRGGEYFRSRGYAVNIKTNISDTVVESDVLETTNHILGDSRYTTVLVAYQNFISTFEQEPNIRQIIPVKRDMVRDMVKNIRPAKGKYAPSSVSDEKTSPVPYTIEPDADAILATLLPKLINVALFHSLLESKASEHSARMVAMKNATDKAKEMAHILTRKFNKVRQAAITREVSEITSGIEAMR